VSVLLRLFEEVGCTSLICQVFTEFILFKSQRGIYEFGNQILEIWESPHSGGYL